MDLALSYCHLAVGYIRSGNVCRKLVNIRLYITQVSVVNDFFFLLSVEAVLLVVDPRTSAYSPGFQANIAACVKVDPLL